MLRRYAGWFFFGLGLLLFGWALRSAEPGQLFHALRSLERWGWIVLFFYPLACLWEVAAWRWTFPAEWRGRVSFVGLFLIRLAGESVNTVTPGVDIGGEPLKVLLVSRRFGLPKTQALASAVLARTAQFAAEALFILYGFALSLFLTPMPSEWKWGFFLTIDCFVVGTVVLALAEKRGLLTNLLKSLNRLGYPAAGLERLGVPFQAADEAITALLRNEKPAMVRCLVLYTAGWFFGGLEIYLFAAALGTPVSVAESLLLESLLQTIRLATFFIPANLGSQEGGLACLVVLLGFHPGFGIALSLLKRSRQILWTAAGFAVWAANSRILKRRGGQNARPD